MERQPGAHLEYVALYRQLADVLDGTINVRKYQRAEAVGYRAIDPPEGAEVVKTYPLNHRVKLDNFNKYQQLSQTLYLKESGEFRLSEGHQEVFGGSLNI